MSGRLALFDCDGTLVDSQANICRAIEGCFADAGMEPPDRARSRRVVGLSLVEAMRALAPDAGDAVHAALADGYKRGFQRMRRDGLVEEPLYDGIAALLTALEDDGWQLGVATGKSDRGLRLCLEHHGLHPRFVTLQTADRHPSKPHPSMIAAAMAEAGSVPATTMMIGDTSYDMAMACAAGVHGVGVGWGYHDADELIAAGAETVAGTPSGILEHARTLT